MAARFGVVDLFAGPGGLGEGFASVSGRGGQPFQIEVSVEKEESAHRTLRLRSFVREFVRKNGSLPSQFIDFHADPSSEPDWSDIDRKSWEHAGREALCLELGKTEATEQIERAIKRVRRDFDDAVLIGGPPCQAYSLVGRARSRGKADYIPEKDERHFLFREYIRVLDRLRPAVFVMENVKGMLSSSVDSRMVFEMLMEDLSSLGGKSGHLYEMLAISLDDGYVSLREPTTASDFIVRAENFGVPQRRHRVIIVGIRSDLARRFSGAEIQSAAGSPSLEDAIGRMPKLRSGLSKTNDSAAAWVETVADAAARISRAFQRKGESKMESHLLKVSRRIRATGPLSRSSLDLPENYGKHNSDLMNWIERPSLRAISLHETRGHMGADLSRYLFATIFAKENKRSPKAVDFPSILIPDHKNWHTGIFADRFRVQVSHLPSTTVTSHISKDGHYFIHPEPMQCRSLTVREAARLQTFPDDYMFLGNRTQQYVQVGNAVPPFLAKQIAQLIYSGLK